MRSYRPEELFDEGGAPIGELAALSPTSHRRMSANPHANGGKREGVITKGQPVLDPVVTSLTPPGDPTRAEIRDCFDATHWLNYKVTGGLQNNNPGGRHLTTAIVQDTGWMWKVTRLVVRGVGTC